MEDIGTVIGSLGGVILGWGLTQASTWLGIRQADKRIIKETLYSLLELHNLLNGLVLFDKRLPLLISLFKKHFPVAPPPELEEALDELLAGLLRDSLSPLISQQLADLKDGYHASLLKLAPVDPVNAYRLRGQADVMQRLPQLMQGLQAAGAKHLDSTSPPPPNLLTFFQQHFEESSITDARDTVREIIDQLAKQLDRRTQKRLAEVLAYKEPTEQELAAEAEEYMQKLRIVAPDLVKS